MAQFVTTVCEGKIQVEEDTVLISTEYNGKIYYFCEQQCLDDFWKNPDVFLVEHKPKPPVISLDNL